MNAEKTISNRMVLPMLLTLFMVISMETGKVFAGISKEGPDEYCNLCHTGGSDTDGTTNQTCIECHSSSESSTYYNLGGYRVPVVNYTGPDPPVDYLAGGNFWWVREGNEGADDSKGHNVFPGEGDDKLPNAPGGITCFTNSCHSNLHLEYKAMADPGLYGRQGCTGCHMIDDLIQPYGFHHAMEGDPLGIIIDFPWYRFLKGHNRGRDSGVIGIEDTEWQANNESDPENHNEYLGKKGGNASERWPLSHNNTITAFCSGCHGKFHMQQKEGYPNEPWIRHPSDVPLPDSGEYKGYAAYDHMVPVARPDLSAFTAPDNTIRSGIDSGNDMVMCLSCHRPHGSPYPDMLRWNPNTCEGCIICHTSKSLSHGPCNKCHTMHNSQDGMSILPVWPTEGPYHSLLSMGCLDCHPSEASSIDLDQKADWSMVSLPVNPESSAATQLFPEAVVIYTYEKGYGYKRIIKEKGLDVGKGYWILFSEDKNYTLTGESILKYTLPACENGWYIIGGCTSPARASINIGNIVVIYGYVPGSGYKRVLESEDLEPGKGYWILFNDIPDQAELTVKKYFEHDIETEDKQQPF